MIPRTYPTNADGEVVVALYAGDGPAWVDYIPVAVSPEETPEDYRYDDDGAMHCDVLLDTTGLRAWADYIPVTVVSFVAGNQWRSDDDGFIPVHGQEAFE